MKTDQFDDTADDVVLARCVSMLVSALYDEEGYPIDIADKKGREELIRVIEALPREIHARLSESDRKLLNEYMETLDKLQKELKKTQEAIRFYIRWGCVAVAVSILIPIVAAFFMIHHYGSEELWCRIQNCLG